MRLILLYTISTVLFSLSYGLSAHAEEVSFETDVSYKKNDQLSFTDLKSGESIQLVPGESVLVNTKNGLPLLVYSAQSKSAKMIVTSANLNAILQEQLRPTLEKATNEVIDALRKTESFLQKRDYTQALASITTVRDKYKNISAVLFMSGTVFYLMNNKSSAIEDLQKGLAIDPENASAKKLLAQLKGNS